VDLKNAKRALTLTGALIVAAVVIASAGARTTAPAKTLNLTSRSSILAYLGSVGVDARTVVFQHGTRNYAGPSCPGQGWNCTSARQVVQFGDGSGGNQFTCTPASAGTASPTTCVIVQVSTSGTNSATCVQRSLLPGASQACTITQQNVSGLNQSVVDERAVQRDGQSQLATQDAQVTQANGSGKNSSTLAQTIWQLTSSVTATSSVVVAPSAVAQDQDAEQNNALLQTATTGDQASTMSQFVAQRADTNAGSGTQNQTGNGTATVDQHSAGVSTSDNDQKMNQQMQAPRGAAVVQTQIGPFRCCSVQDSNPHDTFTLKQSKTQIASTLQQQPSAALSPSGALSLQAGGSSQSVSVWGEMQTSGHADTRQVVDENGTTQKNRCVVNGGTCFALTTCGTGGSCNTCTSTDNCCRIDCDCGPSCIAANRQDDAEDRALPAFRRS
jgi:hypothetical protein